MRAAAALSGGLEAGSAAPMGKGTAPTVGVMAAEGLEVAAAEVAAPAGRAAMAEAIGVVVATPVG